MKNKGLTKAKRVFAFILCVLMFAMNGLISFAEEGAKESKTPVEDYGILTSVKLTSDSAGQNEVTDGEKWHIYGSAYINYTWKLNNHTSGDIVTFDLPDVFSAGSKGISFYLYAPDGETKVGLVQVPKDTNHVTVTFLDDPDKEGNYLADHAGITGTMQFAVIWKSDTTLGEKEVTFVYDTTSKSYRVDIYNNQEEDDEVVENINKWGFYYNENGSKYVSWEVDINSAINSNVDFSKGTFTEQLGEGQKMVESTLDIARRYWDSSKSAYGWENIYVDGQGLSGLSKYIKSLTINRDSNNNATGFYVEFVDGPINGEFIFGFDSVTIDGYSLGPTEYTNYAKFTKNENEQYEVNVNSIDRSGSGNAVGYTTSVKLKKTDANPTSSNPMPLAGAEFKLVKGTAIDGEVVRENLTTDINGEILVKALGEGIYSLVETVAPIGYKLDTTPQTFEIDYSQADINRVVSIDLVMANSLLDNSIKVTKNYEESNESIEEAGLAEFTIFKEDGTVVAVMNRVGNVYTYENIATGSYYIEETKVPSGYVKADNVLFSVNQDRTILITEKGTTATEVIQGSQYDANVNIHNKIERGTVTLIKQDFIDKNAVLVGAVFKLQKKELGTYVDVEGKTQLVTNGEGKIIIEDLLPGEYQLVETQAPSGYELDDTPVTFEVGPNSYIIAVYKANKKKILDPVVKGTTETNPDKITTVKATTENSSKNTTTAATSTTIAPKTADTENSVLWIFMLLFSAGALCFAGKMKKSKV